MSPGRDLEAARKQARGTVDGGRTGLLGLVVGVVGLGLWLADFLLFDRDAAIHAYLVAWIFGLTIALGALCLVMIGYITGARWIIVVRRLAEAMTATIPLFALGAVPILFWLPELYPWARPLSQLSEELQKSVVLKDNWLNVEFFRMRTGAYFAVWLVLGALFWRWSVGLDEHPREPAPKKGHHLGKPVQLSAVGLPLFALSLTFASFDWLMSMQPQWSSTIFGGYIFGGTMVGALAMMVILSTGFRRGGLLEEVVATNHFYALGRLLLTFVIFWAYMAYSQGFIIWIANIPSGVSFYLMRWDQGWSWALAVLAIGHFLLPFLLLLNYGLKWRPVGLSLVAGWLLLMHWVDMYWLVMPTLSGAGPWPGWEQAPALLMVCGLAVAFGAWRLAGHAATPWGDPKFEASLKYDSR